MPLPATKKEREFVVVLREQGKTQMEIAEALGRTHQWVSKVLIASGKRWVPAGIKDSDFRPLSNVLENI